MIEAGNDIYRTKIHLPWIWRFLRHGGKEAIEIACMPAAVQPCLPPGLSKDSTLPLLTERWI